MGLFMLVNGVFNYETQKTLKLKGLIKMQNIKIEEIYIGAEKLKRNMKGESNV